ncbi:FimB/Mfa2 family fimbrial subunit [Alistipes sp.]|uniref:FimB/Mfa2 family fimbrial subunit n=1 Tax=Alistipes sp. TaxID=1872444 RepID=UPI003AB71F5C
MDKPRIFLLSLLSLLCAGCISEDLSKCDRGFSLELSYTGDGSDEIFHEKICHVMLYVFDGEDLCVDLRPATDAEIAAHTVRFSNDYPEGDYRVICLGNPHDTKTTDPEGCGCDEMRFADPAWFEGGEIASNDSLYYAATDITIARGRSGRQTARFASSHYKIYVEVAGFDPAAVTPVLRMHGVCPATDFENRACGDPMTYHLQTSPYDARSGRVFSRFNIMRRIGDDTGIELLDADGGRLAAVNLPEFLAEHDEIDLSKHEVLIPVSFRFKDIGVEISVPDWYIEDVKPEI